MSSSGNTMINIKLRDKFKLKIILEETRIFNNVTYYILLF